jgi:hypothetical protein
MHHIWLTLSYGQWWKWFCDLKFIFFTPNLWILDSVHHNTMCLTPPSDPFRIYLIFSVFRHRALSSTQYKWKPIFAMTRVCIILGLPYLTCKQVNIGTHITQHQYKLKNLEIKFNLAPVRYKWLIYFFHGTLNINIQPFSMQSIPIKYGFSASISGNRN